MIKAEVYANKAFFRIIDQFSAHSVDLNSS